MVEYNDYHNKDVYKVLWRKFEQDVLLSTSLFLVAAILDHLKYYSH